MEAIQVRSLCIEFNREVIKFFPKDGDESLINHFYQNDIVVFTHNGHLSHLMHSSEYHY